MTKKGQNTMSVCENCHNYKKHGNKCWYYWEDKKACSQYTEREGEEPKYNGLIQIQ